MAQEENFALQKEEKAGLFWKAFTVFFNELERKIRNLKNSNHIFDSTIIDNRLPVAEAKDFLKQASEIGLPIDFLGQFAELKEKMRVVDEHMNLGAKELSKSPSNFFYEKENIHGMAYRFREKYLK